MKKIAGLLATTGQFAMELISRYSLFCPTLSSFQTESNLAVSLKRWIRFTSMQSLGILTLLADRARCKMATQHLRRPSIPRAVQARDLPMRSCRRAGADTGVAPSRHHLSTFHGCVDHVRRQGDCVERACSPPRVGRFGKTDLGYNYAGS